MHICEMIARYIQSSWAKLTKWEYWPFELVYLPVFAYYFFLSIRARSFFFFSAANPGIETGGMLGESKFAILEKIPSLYKARTILIDESETLNTVLEKVLASGIGYPHIAKPDIGERGNGVEKINNEAQLIQYYKKYKFNFLIQEYVSLPIELGIFYYRLSGSKVGTISSVVQKDFLHVVGNGEKNIGMLMRDSYRAAKQYERLKSSVDYEYVPRQGECIVLEVIGNHCRGTKFLDATSHIDMEMTNVIDQISKSIPGFYYGRFDLKCASIEGLKRGEGIKIMELNGAGAEPAHIYQPGFSLLKAWEILLHHWHVLYTISMENHVAGERFMKLEEAKMYYQRSKVMKDLTKGYLEGAL